MLIKVVEYNLGEFLEQSFDLIAVSWQFLGKSVRDRRLRCSGVFPETSIVYTIAGT
jgi:hypothetical protein